MEENATSSIAPSRRFSPYPSYKDSGVEWLGQIPSHWSIKRLKFIASINDDVLAETTDSQCEITYVDIGGVDQYQGIVDREKYVFETAPSRARRKVREGDVIISTVRTYLRAIAQIDAPESDLIVSTGFAVIRPGPIFSSHYAAYALRASYFIEKIVANSVGVSYPAIDASKISRFRVAFPELTKQESIADFLDLETAKFDALISKKERLIELLQEKRTALITQAVTKGLYPNVPMKDSGVEWLGKIPAHWEVTTLKRIGDLQAGAGFPDEEQGVESQDIPFFKVGDMGIAANKKEMVDCPNTVSQTTARRLRAFIFPAQTIVFAKVGAALLLNRRRLLKRASCIDNNMMGFIPEYCDPIWALYWLCGLDLAELANPGAVPSVNEGQMRDIAAVVPPLDEQRAIAELLDGETAKIDALVIKLKEAIERLSEYRMALISAAVTGKIDVRAITA